jgi:hypothetical protein
MDRSTTREVDCLELVGDPAAVLTGESVEREHPVCDREVDEGRPQTREGQPRAELQPVGDRTRDEGDRDDREHQLEHHEHQLRNGACQRDIHRIGRCRPGGRIRGNRGFRVTGDQTLQAPVLRRVADEIELVVAEGQRVAVQHPQHRHDTHGADAHHQHVEHTLGAHHAAIEERQSWRHQQHQRGACQHPCRIPGVGDAHYRKAIHSQFPPSTCHSRNVFTTVDLLQDNAEWLFRLGRCGVSLV